MILKLLLVISSIQISSNIAQHVYDGFVPQYNQPGFRNWNGVWFSTPAQTYTGLYDQFQDPVTERSASPPYSSYINQPAVYFNPNERNNNLQSDSFQINPELSHRNELGYDFDTNSDSRSYLNDDSVYPNDVNPIGNLPPTGSINYNPNLQEYDVMSPATENRFVPNPFIQPFGNSFPFVGEPNYNGRNVRKLNYLNDDNPVASDTYSDQSSEYNLYYNSFERGENDVEVSDEPGASYGYKNNGTYLWPINYPICGGSRQSPIDLRLEQMKPMFYFGLKWNNYAKLPRTMNISNNGLSLELNVDYFGSRPFITGGPFKGKQYIFQSLHFHWGDDSSKGSEHTIYGRSYPIELHLVHYNSLYESFENALTETDGLAVVAFMFDVYYENKALDLILNEVNDIIQPDEETQLSYPFPLTELINTFSHFYVTYKGSLTTPPCYETVTWIISKHILPISERQLTKFRMLISKEGGQLVNNFRPTQRLNGRHVFFVK